MKVFFNLNTSKQLRKIIFAGLCFISCAVTACPAALSPNTPGFCESFKSVARCHCTASGLPGGMCTNMKLLYNRMISTFGTLQRACEYQRDTTVQACLEAWNCYRSGGVDSQNQLCNGTGLPCER
jgi:hypothetical protein